MDESLYAQRLHIGGECGATWVKAVAFTGSSQVQETAMMKIADEHLENVLEKDCQHLIITSGLRYSKQEALCEVQPCRIQEKEAGTRAALKAALAIIIISMFLAFLFCCNL